MAPKTSAHKRGLGYQHRKTRDGLLRVHVDGTPCWWCGEPMFRDPTLNVDYNPMSSDPDTGILAADHSHSRAHGGAKADRLLHGRCNKQRGDGSRDHLRPAITGGRVEDPTAIAPELGVRAMAWPR
ncbi:hypothetical protein GS4_47_00070 [Gordonia soli NBRC 108243]|uniref:HNH domain-containing protein n=1 Tax=Gordonia soli NBRC 108243 TaxID=1223545 RepID=M0QS87_9ACTN|nr:hypothetical protein [Gordonia soli]GAC71017.1 hypothetical protein GS4_47_00070 [Gordonia soli NBRC 108243]